MVRDWSSATREFMALGHVQVFPRIWLPLHGADLVHETCEGYGLLRRCGPDVVGIGNEFRHFLPVAALLAGGLDVDLCGVARVLVDELMRLRQRGVDRLRHLRIG